MSTPREADATDRSAISRLLYAFDRWAGRATVSLGVVSVSAVWVLISILFGFPGRLETAFQSLVAALTLAMVFVIQHTQTRHQVATQRKLDEILRALPEADNAIISLEDADDATLASTRDTHRDLRRDALEG